MPIQKYIQEKILLLTFLKEKVRIQLHKSLTDRNFVLYPLKEICPNWVHPITKTTIDVLIKYLKKVNNEITKLSENDINSYVK